jgi:MFS transporter, UMF1 family
MSCGLAITRRIERWTTRAISASHSRTKGSAVAITASFAVSATGRMRKRPAYALDITSVTAEKSIFSGSMCRYSRPARCASHSASASSVSGLCGGRASFHFSAAIMASGCCAAAPVAALLLQLLGRLAREHPVLDQPVEHLREGQAAVGGRLAGGLRHGRGHYTARMRHAPRQGARPEVKPREVWAWSMYDFANSGYTTVVITAVFNAYFVGAVAGGAPWATFAWTAALSVSYFLVLLTAPLVGAWADAHAAKKRLLAWATAGCVLFTAALYFAAPGAVALAIVLVILSNYFFSAGENLIAAFLPELADSQAMGRVSGWGWAFGYLGGLLSLGISLAYITWAQGQGQTGAQFVPVVMVITAVVFALCALPTFAFLRERARPQPALENPWARLLRTAREAARYRDLRRFLLCIVFYQAGIMAVIALAAIYAQEAMKFTQTQTIVLILVVNVTAAAGAFGFGYLQDAIGHVRAMALILSAGS